MGREGSGQLSTQLLSRYTMVQSEDIALFNDQVQIR